MTMRMEALRTHSGTHARGFRWACIASQHTTPHPRDCTRHLCGKEENGKKSAFCAMDSDSEVGAVLRVRQSEVTQWCVQIDGSDSEDGWTYGDDAQDPLSLDITTIDHSLLDMGGVCVCV